MKLERYNFLTKECKDCGCLIPDRPQDIKEHYCSPYAIERKLKALFGAKEPKVERKFKVGQEVEASLIGIVDADITTQKGDILYRVSDDAKNIGGWFLQGQVTSLNTPIEDTVNGLTTQDGE